MALAARDGVLRQPSTFTETEPVDTGSRSEDVACASVTGELPFLLVSKADPHAPAIKARTIKPRFS
jgi:hypothetical protein